MSNEEFNNYVALMGKLLQLTPSQRDQISGELQDHLQMRVAELMEAGIAKPAAISQALDEFGDAAAMAKNFQTVHKLNRQRWMMRFTTYAIAASFLMAVFVMAMWPEKARFGTPSQSLAVSNDVETNQGSDSPAARTISHATLQNLKTENTLKKIVSLDYDENPFSDIEIDLESLTQLNFLLDDSAMDDSLPTDEPVTFRLRDVPLNKALSLMLLSKNATYLIDEGVVRIISLDEAYETKFMRLKMFDCKDLVKKLPQTAPEPVAFHTSSQGGGGLGGGGFGGGSVGGGGIFSIQAQLGGTETNEPAETSESKLLDQKISKIIALLAERQKPEPTSEHTLRRLVEDLVEPDSWGAAGGLAQIRVSNGMLIVRQTESALIEIENLLQDLSANVFTSAGQSVSLPTIPEKLQRQPSGKKKPAKKSSAKGEDPFGLSAADDDPFGS